MLTLRSSVYLPTSGQMMGMPMMMMAPPGVPMTYPQGMAGGSGNDGGGGVGGAPQPVIFFAYPADALGNPAGGMSNHHHPSSAYNNSSDNYPRPRNSDDNFY